MKAYIKEILKKRNDISEENYSLFSQKICERIHNLKEYKECGTVLIFYPYSGEADILPIAKNALSEGKQVFFPRVTSDTEMEFVKIEDLNNFHEGYKGIMEPVGNILFNNENIRNKTVMILPGSAFDFTGNRAGYGKGYYDRYLEKCYTHITKVGVCFSIQMLKQLPDVKITDIPMNYIINENQIVRSEQ